MSSAIDPTDHYQERMLDQQPIVSPAEGQRLLVEFNNTARDYPSDQCIHQLFEQQVERTPKAIALVFGDQTLTYQQLNRRANQLAHHLQQQGVAPDTLVGLCLERSLEMIIGLLAILKAGGAYVPLDPGYPTERLVYMVQDAQLSLVITQAGLAPQIQSVGIQVIDLDRDHHSIKPEPDENPVCKLTPENLAYVIYTSGSTGQPKGVLLAHQGICNLVCAEIELFNLQPSSRVVQFASLSFDVSVSEIFTTLCAGATLYLATKETLLPGYSLTKFLQSHAITHAALPPSALAVMPDLPLPALAVLIVGGEACSQKLIRRWAVGRRFFNAYGPTETTVDATIALCTPESEPVIGRPLANKQAYILDAALQLVPIGVSGELHIGGVGLARGYLNRPELTREKFIPHPFEPGERLYKTGDLARYQTDGTIEFLGRLDQQVKIRGYRIELGEIEVVLEQHPAVQQAVVLVRADNRGDKQLLAYVVPHSVDENEESQAKATQEFIALWRTVNEQTDEQVPLQTDNAFNIVGWNSSYTLAPIAALEMSEWLHNTLARIRELNPQKVLEIGCGTGLLLTQIAPECDEYVGIDFNAPSLNHIRQVQQHVQGLDHVVLLERTADDLTGLMIKSFDTVIINSVVQYFPNLAYLNRVLAGAIARVKPGGHILVGDVRNLALLEPYAVSIETHRAADQVTRKQLQQRIRRRMKEEELLLDPHFFTALQDQYPEIVHVQIQPKQGQFHNELTRFRYEAILSVEKLIQPTGNVTWLNWQQERLTLATLHDLLAEPQLQRLGVRQIPNARLQDELYVMRWLSESRADETVGQLRAALAEQPQVGIELDTIYKLGVELSYGVEVSWLNTDASGCYDVVFTPASLPLKPVIFAVDNDSLSSLGMRREQSSNVDRALWVTDYANNPIQTQFNQQLVIKLCSFVQARLPEYMVPSAFETLRALPLTPNDKVDYQTLTKLPVDNYASIEKGSKLAPPQTPLEMQLVQLWSEVLDVDRVGIHDSFFELGGNSLKVILLLNRLQEQLGCPLQMIDLFNAPTIAEFSACLAKKTAEKTAISSIALDRVIDRSNTTHNYPASFKQQRFCFYQKSNLNISYNFPYRFRVIGQLDISILQRCFDEMIRRHEILRTTLQEIEGSLVQVIALTDTINLLVVDLQTLPEQEQILEIERLAVEQLQIPTALDRDPWWRVILLRLSEESYILMLCMHNLLVDGNSLAIVLQELKILYKSFLLGKESPLPELPSQYKDYALSQQQLLTPDVLQARANYWQQWLNEPLQTLELPTDRPLPAMQTFQAGKLNYQFSHPLSQDLKALSKQTQVTLFTILLAALVILFHCYSGSESIVLGVAASGRNHRNLEYLIGDFSRLVTVRIDLSGEPSFLEVLTRARQEVLEAMSHQDVPFEQLLKSLPIKPTKPLFKVIVDFLPEVASEQLNFTGLTVTSLPLQETLMRADLNFMVWERTTSEGTVVEGTWQYKKDIFDVETIAQMSDQFQHLLADLVAAPDVAIDHLVKA